MPRVFVDSNVLVYRLDPREPEKRRIATDRLRSEERTSDLVVSTQVLMEVYAVLTRGERPLADPYQAEAVLEEIATYHVVPIDARLVFRAVHVKQRNRLSIWDALIVEAASTAGCDRLLTEDLNDGEVIDGIAIENPFAARTAPPTALRKRKRRT